MSERAVMTYAFLGILFLFIGCFAVQPQGLLLIGAGAAFECVAIWQVVFI